MEVLNVVGQMGISLGVTGRKDWPFHFVAGKRRQWFRWSYESRQVSCLVLLEEQKADFNFPGAVIGSRQMRFCTTRQI